MATFKRENSVITALGDSILAYAILGDATLNITRAVVRDTVSTASANVNYTLADITTASIKQTGVLLDKEVITNPSTGVKDTTVVTARFSNENLSSASTTYNIRQVILFAQLTNIKTGSDAPTGEVPFIVSQSLGESDYDVMPKRSDSPTSLDYAIHVVHTGVPSITVSVRTSGFISETTFNNFKTEIETTINTLSANAVGKKAEGKVFTAWKPKYTETHTTDPDYTELNWESIASTLPATKRTGEGGAEYFNAYTDLAGNVAIGGYSTVEGLTNMTTASRSHVEGEHNYVGYGLNDNTGDINKNANRGTHVEGAFNAAVIGWTQHIEGTNNFSEGYLAHVEGKNNRLLESANADHVEGESNRVESATTTHIEGYENKALSGKGNHIEGRKNTIATSNYSHVGGYGNALSNSAQTYLLGATNTADSDSSSLVVGYNNELHSTIANTVLGTDNQTTNSQNTVICGHGNIVNMQVECAFVVGYTNSVYHTKHSTVVGKENTVDHIISSAVFGTLNNVAVEVKSDNTQSIVGGYSNRFTDFDNSNLGGSSNNVQGVENTIVYGTYNTVVLESKDGSKANSVGAHHSALFGRDNSVKQVQNSVITGANNNISDYRPHGVVGEFNLTENNMIAGKKNTVTGMYNSILFGTNNTVNNLATSIVGGNNNRVDGKETGKGYSNAVICVGNDNVIEQSDLMQPQAVFGDNNEIKGNRSLTVGTNLISESNASLTVGKFNAKDSASAYALVIGGGTSNSNRRNILTVDWSGNVKCNDIAVGNLTSIVTEITTLKEQVASLIQRVSALEQE